MRGVQPRSAPKFLVLLASCAMMFAASSAAHTSPSRRSPPAPRIVTPFTSFEFGDVYTGEIISHIFIIRNEGDADLKILDFKGG
jgi:hypothetical protein